MTKTTKSVVEVEAKLNNYATISLDQYTAEMVADLLEMQSALSSVYRKKCDVFTSKIGIVDPVTQAPRYGPSMVQKIKSLSDKIDELIEVADSLVSRLHENGQMQGSVESASPSVNPIPLSSDVTLFTLSSVFAPPSTQATRQESPSLNDKDTASLSRAAAHIREDKVKQRQLGQKVSVIACFLPSVTFRMCLRKLPMLVWSAIGSWRRGGGQPTPAGYLSSARHWIS